MDATGAADGSRLLRLGLAAGAASIGAVALSLLLGGASAEAADDGGLSGLSDATVAATSFVTEPVDELVTELEPIAAPAQPVIVPDAPTTAPIVPMAVAAPQPVVEAVAAQAAPAAEAIAPTIDPLSPLAEPVERIAADVVAPTVTPLVRAVGQAVDAAPIAGGLLGDETLGEVLLAAEGATPAEPTPAEQLVEPAPAEQLAIQSELPGDLALVPAEPAVLTDDPEASVVAATVRATGLMPSATPMDASPPGDRSGLPALVPSGSSGSGAPGGQSAAITDAGFSPALTGGKTGAAEHDRIPASPVEELTASPG